MSAAAFTLSFHIALQDKTTPDRPRFFVKRSPLGVIVIVNGSESISISRRSVLSSLVAMEGSYPRVRTEFDARWPHNSD